jgi:hypothetical protein
MSASLDTLGRGEGAYTEKQIRQIEEWLDEDWESHDCDRRLLKIVRRLIATVTSVKEKKK